MKKSMFSALQIIIVATLTGSMVYAMQPPETQVKSSVSESRAVAQTVEGEPVEKTEQEAPQKTPEVIVTWESNPNSCNLETQYVSKDAPFNCIDKPVPARSAVVPVGVHDVGGTGDCAAEIAKYNWPQAEAILVATAESGLRPGVINHNPGTGDYSIGCFQVNIYGANAASRPSQEQLLNAQVNVQWAYNNYVANKSSFRGQWGVCRIQVQCS